ncbi:MAG: homocysteine S-methyltransferase family protein [Rhodobiaceae bacterium]|nr:homocysteine S-methyltransferase family protein [Rhodobiaceae bacterium]MCC0053765.1 homocysteine S-methyltransferase family protein [Rhodobiaceae bacterium]
MTRIALLDGGMGQELLKRSSRPPSPLWSAQVMLDEPAIVEDVHLAYIEAGARIITLNAYTATPERLARDADASLFEPLQRAAIAAAERARARSGRQVRIAGCLPPLVASYLADVAPDDETALATYRRIVTMQADAVDLFLCETMPSVRLARAAATAAVESGKPVWLSLTITDDTSATLRSGEPLGDALAQLGDCGAQAFLLNCSKPEAIDAAWPVMARQDRPVGAYANGFTSIETLKPGGTVASLEARHDLGPEQYAAFAMNWVRNGARVVGGCCEVGPAHIAELARQLAQAGLEITGEP